MMKLCKHTKKNRCTILDRDVPHDGFECAFTDTCKEYDSPSEEEMWQFVLVKLSIYKHVLENLQQKDKDLTLVIEAKEDRNWTWRHRLKEDVDKAYLVSALALIFSILSIAVGFVL